MDARSTIGILAYPGALASAVLGLQDVIGHANTISQSTLEIRVLKDLPQTDAVFAALVLPPSAGEVSSGAVPMLPDFLKRQHAKGAVICSACTGVNFVAAAGLAGERPVTTHWGLEQRLRSAYPALKIDVDKLLIEYADLITAGGLMAWVDLALALIERFHGYETAAATARHFIVEFHRRDQRRFRRFLPDLRHGDAAVLRVQHHLETHVADEVTVTDMARVGGLPDRSLQRRFKAATGCSPKAYLQELRIERARGLLIDTNLQVAEICYAVGYNDPPSFVRLFTRLSGLTPGAFREQYGRRGKPR